MRTKAYNLNRNKFLDDGELTNLSKVLQRCSKDDRNKILIELALATGARAQELLNIKREDLFESTKSVLIHGLKGSNDREIPLPPKLFTAVLNFSKTHHDPRVFPISYHRLHTIWGFYRPCKKKFHALRHTFAFELYKKTKDIRLVQLALGHRNIQNTEIYMTFDYSQNQMRRLICG
jgi:site-specific recombinase XerD